MFFWKTAKETVPERPIRISSVEWRDGQQSLFSNQDPHTGYAPDPAEDG